MPDWSLTIDGHEYHPVPESWIEHGIDDRDGAGPQLLAVSAATWRRSLRIRYAHPRGTRIGQVIEPAIEGDDGLYPERLAQGTWPRSIAAARLEPVGDIRLEEREALPALWEEHLNEALQETPDFDLDDRRLVADGGHSKDGTEQGAYPRVRSRWACKECGYRPSLWEIDENGADECPECGCATNTTIEHGKGGEQR